MRTLHWFFLSIILTLSGCATPGVNVPSDRDNVEHDLIESYELTDPEIEHATKVLLDSGYLPRDFRTETESTDKGIRAVARMLARLRKDWHRYDSELELLVGKGAVDPRSIIEGKVARVRHKYPYDGLSCYSDLGDQRLSYQRFLFRLVTDPRHKNLHQAAQREYKKCRMRGDTKCQGSFKSYVRSTLRAWQNRYQSLSSAERDRVKRLTKSDSVTFRKFLKRSYDFRGPSWLGIAPPAATEAGYHSVCKVGSYARYMSVYPTLHLQEIMSTLLYLPIDRVGHFRATRMAIETIAAVIDPDRLNALARYHYYANMPAWAEGRDRAVAGWKRSVPDANAYISGSLAPAITINKLPILMTASQCVPAQPLRRKHQRQRQAKIKAASASASLVEALGGNAGDASITNTEFHCFPITSARLGKIEELQDRESRHWYVWLASWEPVEGMNPFSLPRSHTPSLYAGYNTWFGSNKKRKIHRRSRMSGNDTSYRISECKVREERAGIAGTIRGLKSLVTGADTICGNLDEWKTYSKKVRKKLFTTPRFFYHESNIVSMEDIAAGMLHRTFIEKDEGPGPQ